jgi:putative GTP pyrophosphokinase
MFEQLRDEYGAIQDVATNVLDSLVLKISSLIKASKIDLSHPVYGRLKTWESIEEKLQRLNFKVKSLKSLDDLMGIRVIVLFKSDVEKVGRIISEHFDVKKEVLSSNRSDVDRFGYGSDHYIVNTNENFKAEIQLRTLSQHIWAEASHRLYYKNENTVPRQLRRSIHRTSALLEVVDYELERLREERQGFVEKYGEFVDLKDDDQLSEVAVQLVLDNLLPKKNFQENDHYFGLMTELLHLGIRAVGSLKAFITENHDFAIEEERQYMKLLLKDASVSEEIKAHLRDTGMYCSHVSLVRTMLMKKYGDSYRGFDLNQNKNGET